MFTSCRWGSLGRMVIRVFVLVEERYRQQAQPQGLVRALSASAGQVRVTLIGDAELALGGSRSVAAADAADLAGSADVVVARGRSEVLLSALWRLEAQGCPVVDPASAVAAVRDKGVMGAMLAEAGVPLPATWVGGGRALANELSGLQGRCQLIAKPVLGDNGRGIHRLGSPAQLRDLPGDLVVQEFLPGSGADLKLYVIGEQVWATRKASPVTPCTLPAERLGPCAVTPRLREIALTCGQVFGLSLYGVDCVEVDGEVVVVEVNDFPNYTHVPEADELLARHVLGRVA